MDLNNTIQVNNRLLSPASYELFEELNGQLQGGCPIKEICDFLHETAWQETLNTGIREVEDLPEDILMDVYQGEEFKGKV